MRSEHETGNRHTEHQWSRHDKFHTESGTRASLTIRDLPRLCTAEEQKPDRHMSLSAAPLEFCQCLWATLSLEHVQPAMNSLLDSSHTSAIVDIHNKLLCEITMTSRIQIFTVASTGDGTASRGRPIACAAEERRSGGATLLATARACTGIQRLRRRARRSNSSVRAIEGSQRSC